MRLISPGSTDLPNSTCRRHGNPVCRGRGRPLPSAPLRAEWRATRSPAAAGSVQASGQFGRTAVLRAGELPDEMARPVIALHAPFSRHLPRRERAHPNQATGSEAKKRAPQTRLCFAAGAAKAHECAGAAQRARKQLIILHFDCENTLLHNCGAIASEKCRSKKVQGIELYEWGKWRKEAQRQRKHGKQGKDLPITTGPRSDDQGSLTRGLTLATHARELLQLRVLSFRGDEDGNIGVGVFPQREEILIGEAGFGGIALHSVGATELKMGKSLNR